MFPVSASSNILTILSTTKSSFAFVLSSPRIQERKKIFKLIVGRRQHHRRTSQEIWAKYVLISLAAAMRACLCGGSSIRYASDHGETPDTGVEELSVPTAREIVRRDTGQVLYHRATIVSHDIPSGLRFGANATMTNA
mmetsp:Transcript_28501/g.41984  ORF Transcript_28501/g.41984 Transcript_28501/m.41984 type:complete len:138 (-) Transcript_28501:263-676(-)